MYNNFKVTRSQPAPAAPKIQLQSNKGHSDSACTLHDEVGDVSQIIRCLDGFPMLCRCQSFGALDTV